jgi:hypothetical protein
MTVTLESVDRRVLGGFVFVDSITSTSITSPLNVTSEKLQIKGNRSGIYAIFNGPGFALLTDQFIPIGTWPPLHDFDITVTDPGGQYLARRAQVQAPRKLVGAFAPQKITLYPSPRFIVELNWAVVRASVSSAAGDQLPWSVVQVILKSDSTLLATGVADERGEALLAVAGRGFQVSDKTTDPVTETTEAVTVQAWFDLGVLNQPKNWTPNPDDILGNLANPALKTAKSDGALSPRQSLVVPITISV